MSTRLLLAFLVAAVPACTTTTTTPTGGGGGGDPVGDTINEGHATGANLSAEAFGELSADDNLTMIGKTAGILAALNDGELSEANYAVQVVGATDILQFADDMISDHDQANAELDGTVRSYGVPILESDASASIDSQTASNVSNIRAASDPDFTYTEIQVKDHAAAQDVLDQLAQLVGPGAMGDYIANTRALVDDHLDRATALLDSFY